MRTSRLRLWRLTKRYHKSYFNVGRLAEATSHSRWRVSDPPYSLQTSTAVLRFVIHVGRLAEATLFRPLAGQRPALQSQILFSVGRLVEATSHSRWRVSDPPYSRKSYFHVGRLAEATSHSAGGSATRPTIANLIFM